MEVADRNRPNVTLSTGTEVTISKHGNGYWVVAPKADPDGELTEQEWDEYCDQLHAAGNWHTCSRCGRTTKHAAGSYNCEQFQRIGEYRYTSPGSANRQLEKIVGGES